MEPIFPLAPTLPIFRSSARTAKHDSPGRGVVAEERFAQTLGLSTRDHAAPPRGDRHRPGATEDLQLHRGALDAGDAQCHSPIVDLVVAELFQQRVADLRQAEPLLALDHQGHDVDPVEGNRAHLQLLNL